MQHKDEYLYNYILYFPLGGEDEDDAEEAMLKMAIALSLEEQ